MYLKRNGISVSKNLVQYQSTDYLIFSSNLFSLNLITMSILLPWFYVIQESFFWDVSQLRRYGLLDGIHILRMIPLVNSLELREKKPHGERPLIKRVVVPVLPFSSRPLTAGCSAHSVSLLFRHVQIISDNLPNAVLFLCQADSRSFGESTYNRLTTPAPSARHWPHHACWSPPAPEVISSRPTLNLLCHWKMCLYDMVLSPYSC